MCSHSFSLAIDGNCQRADQASTLRAGVTLLEVTIVLLIAVSIIAVALYMSSSTITQSEVAEEVQTMNNLASAVQKTKANGGYPVDIKSTLDTLGITPVNIGYGEAGNFRHPWRGRIYVAQEANGAGFSITYTQIQVPICKLFLSAVKPGILKSFGDGVATKNLADMTGDDVAAACANLNLTFSTIVQN